MSDRTERKLQQVAIGKYGYRHEAEFAAGFLDDAGIPYRLQVDDPVLGFSLSASPATIWVLGVDERRARAVLEHDTPTIETEVPGGSAAGGPPYDDLRRGEESGDESSGDAPDALSAGGNARLDTEATDRHGPPSPWSPDPRHPARRAAATALGGRERFLALAFGAALGVLARLVDLGGGNVATLTAAVLLVVIGLAGRAPAPVKRILAALSGESP